MSSPHDYLIQLQLSPTATVPTPEQGVAFTERYVLPTLAVCEKLAAEGKLLAGGVTAGAMGFTFILRASTAGELDELVSGLPAWPRAQTTITPLAPFAGRAALVRERLTKTKAALAAQPRTASVNV